MTKEEIRQRAKEMIKQTRQSQKKSTATATIVKEKDRQTVENSANDRKQEYSSQGRVAGEQKQVNSEQEEEEVLGAEYICQEILNLKAKQQELDEEGQYIETQLRLLMKRTSSRVSGEDESSSSSSAVDGQSQPMTSESKKSERDKELEDKLLRGWFLLINQKNALLHRQQELELL